MTNREKFIEVFGDNPQRHHITKSWWDEEYVPPQEPKTGHWFNSKVYDNFYICSECGESGYNTFKYCPNCGAKMESEEV